MAAAKDGPGERTAVVALGEIERTIFLVRGHRVLLDADLALLYDVETKALNRAVKRNAERFPVDFMFQLTAAEVQTLRFQSGTSKVDPRATDTGEARGGRRYLPYAFSEQGVAMLSSVLHTPRAVQVNIEIMRAFVRLRQILQQNAELSRKLNALERKYDAQFRIVFDAIRELMEPPAATPTVPATPAPSKRRIGFTKAEK